MQGIHKKVWRQKGKFLIIPGCMKKSPLRAVGPTLRPVSPTGWKRRRRPQSPFAKGGSNRNVRTY